MTINWAEIRNNYPLASKGGYFNTAYFGSISKSTIEAQTKYLQDISQNGSIYHEEWTADAAYIKDQVRDLTKAKNYSIGLGTDVSTSINLVADTFVGNEKVVLLEGDFPAVNIPWIVRNFPLDWIERKDGRFEMDDIKTSLEKGAKIVAVSWVMYNSGVVIDLKTLSQLCQKYGATLIVDATQGLGAVPIDLSTIKIDVLLVSTFKWFLSGYGISMVLVHNDFYKNHALNFAGQNTINRAHFDVKNVSNYKVGAERFELGHIKSQQIVALKTAISELVNIGFDHIQERSFTLVQLLKNRLVDAGFEILTPQPLQSAIFTIKADDILFEKLKAQKIVCTCRDGYIRFALYFYNNEEDVDYLIQTIT